MGRNNKSSQLTILDKVIDYISGIYEFLNQDIDEFYYQLLENAIEYGMTPKQFWEEDIEIYYCYQYAYLNKLHTSCHTQGLYNYLALSVVIGNAFRKTSTKPLEYPKDNLLETNLKELKKEQQKQISSNVTRQNLEEQYRLRLASCY